VITNREDGPVENFTSLPIQLYLLTYNPDKNRIGRAGYLGCTLRAAALTDLFLTGHLLDDSGKVRVAARSAPGGPAALDPFLAGVLDEITAASRPRTWKHYVGRNEKAAVRAVVGQLEAARVVRVEERRVLGVIRLTTVRARDGRVPRALRREVRQALDGTVPVSRVEPRTAALAALASTGAVRTVATRRERWANRERTAAFAGIAGPAIPALRAVVRAKEAESA
jgi:Golgi phosphoprotein 3 (GPP34)